MMILDLGCGRKKIDGAIGIDLSPMSDADIFLDMNVDNLPFADSSIDFLYSSHFLEHLSGEGFFHVIKEIYRVMKPEGQIQIVVPYYATQLNLANPFHNNNITFNEHTFRFFSSEVDTAALERRHYATPSCQQWGLRYSANSEVEIELQTLRVQFFYFPEFRDLSEEEQFFARTSRLSVVDQISYSLKAIKPCPRVPDRGPVSSGENLDQVIQNQISYLREQLTVIDRYAVDLENLWIARGYVSDLERMDQLYCRDGVLMTAQSLVFQLDDVIQRLQRRIDLLQSQKESSPPNFSVKFKLPFVKKLIRYVKPTKDVNRHGSTRSR